MQPLQIQKTFAIGTIFLPNSGKNKFNYIYIYIYIYLSLNYFYTVDFIF